MSPVLERTLDRMAQSAAPSATVPAAGRDVRIDFVRGLALLFMFVEHVPETVLRYLTPAAACIASCTDAFIIISGYVCGIAFGKTMDRRGLPACWLRVAKRCFLLYGAHVATLLAVYGLLVLFSAEALLNPPAENLIVKAASMQWMPLHFSVLSVYITLLAVAPGLIWLLKNRPALGVVASLGVYLLVQVFPQLSGIFAKHGPGVWINPLAWQLLYALGAWFGVRKIQGRGSIPEVKSLLIAATLVTAAGCAWKLARFIIHADIGGIGSWLGMPGVLLPIPEKGNLSPLRLISALATGYVILAALRRSWRRIHQWLIAPIAACGRHSLLIFCTHLVLVYLAELSLGASEPILKQCVVVGSGLTSLLICAWTMSGWERGKQRDAARPVSNDRVPRLDSISTNA